MDYCDLKFSTSRYHKEMQTEKFSNCPPLSISNKLIEKHCWFNLIDFKQLFEKKFKDLIDKNDNLFPYGIHAYTVGCVIKSKNEVCKRALWNQVVLLYKETGF